MKLDDFDYHLPEDRIALNPSSPRDHSRLMVVNRNSGTWSDEKFFNIESHLRPGDVLVLNETKVLPARLYGRDANQRPFELLLVNQIDSTRWECLAKPGRKITAKGLSLVIGSEAVHVSRDGDKFEARFPEIPDFLGWLQKHGFPPLPPYIKREVAQGDIDSYQTVFANRPGSIAAPTAGLHFTAELLEKLKSKGVEIRKLALHVGLATFSPIRADDVISHQMHEEHYEIPEETLSALRLAKKEGRRIIAVGTTSCRALESSVKLGIRGNTRLFLYPGCEFHWVDGLITNFHLPKSTLYILVSAFLGLEKTRSCYEAAIKNSYRFFSYGDAMAILPDAASGRT